MHVSYHSLDYHPVFQNVSPARTDPECSICLKPDLEMINPVQPLRLISGCNDDKRCKKNQRCIEETAHKCIHVFCRACIEGWIAKLNSQQIDAYCPLCGDNSNTLINPRKFKKMAVCKRYQNEVTKRDQLEIEDSPTPKKSKVENCKTVLKVASLLSLALFTIQGGLALMMHSSLAHV